MCLIELSLVHRFTDGFNSNSTQVHEDQSAHVKKGCLSHPHNDIASDGSCIGGPHKHWNSIMRSFTSDTAIMLAHCHNHVARYNIRRSTSCSWNWHSWRLQGLHLQLSPSTIGQSFRHTLEYSTQKIQEWVRHCKPPSTPNFSNVDSKEQFGLVESNHSIMFGGLLPQPKVEPKDEEDLLAVITGSDQIEIDSHFDDLKIYPVLLSQPERPLSGASTTTSIVVPTTIHGCEPAHAPSQLPDITIKWPNSALNSLLNFCYRIWQPQLQVLVQRPLPIHNLSYWSESWIEHWIQRARLQSTCNLRHSPKNWQQDWQQQLWVLMFALISTLGHITNASLLSSHHYPSLNQYRAHHWWQLMPSSKNPCYPSKQAQVHCSQMAQISQPLF